MDKVILDESIHELGESDIFFILYFLVFKTKDDPDVLKCLLFMTLYQLYDFVVKNLDDFKVYRVGRTLETYSI